MDPQHEFHCTLSWTGATTGPGLEPQNVDRTHRLEFEGRPPIVASSAPAFSGDPTKLNPEEMLVGAVSSCQMLTYLAVMARARQPLVAYEDQAVGLLEKNAEGKLWIARITLRPRITLGAGASLEKAQAMVEKAHQHCILATSIKTAVDVQPAFVVTQT